jgi:hypothetical protein
MYKLLIPERLKILDFEDSGVCIVHTGSLWWQATWLRRLQESLPLSLCIRMMCALQSLLYDKVSNVVDS